MSIRPQTKLNINLLETEFQADWHKRVDFETLIIESCLEVVRDKRLLTHCNDLKYSVHNLFASSIEAKKGHAFEDFIFNITKQIKGLIYLESCYSDGTHIKCGNNIKFDYRLYEHVVKVVDTIVKNGAHAFEEITLREYAKSIYDKAVKLKQEKCERTKFYDVTQDLDLGFVDEIMGKTYLFEEKKTGVFGADVAKEHLRKYFCTFANHIYNNDCDFETAFINLLVLENENFKRLSHGDYGFITLEDFFRIFNIIVVDNTGIDVDFEEVVNLFYKTTCFDGRDYEVCIERFKFLYEHYKNFINVSNADSMTIYKKQFGSTPLFTK